MGPLEATNVHKEGLKLHWQPPEDDGGSPVLQYEVEKMDTATGKWVRVGKVPGDRENPELEVRAGTRPRVQVQGDGHQRGG